jgi:hypothetical protein
MTMTAHLTAHLESRRVTATGLPLNRRHCRNLRRLGPDHRRSTRLVPHWRRGALRRDAFPFTRFGALHGKVVSVASAAIAEQDAKRALANAAPEAPSAPGQPESFVFPVTVSLDETAMKIDSAIIPLAPSKS